MLCPTKDEYDLLMAADMSKLSPAEAEDAERLIETYDKTHEGDETPATAEKPHVKCHGNPAGGYIVEVHDGEQHHAFGLDAESDAAAAEAGMGMWREKATKPVDGDGPVPVQADSGPIYGKFEALEARIAALETVQVQRRASSKPPRSEAAPDTGA